MKRRQACGIVMAMVLLSASACGSGSSGNDSGTTVGFIVDKTGLLASSSADYVHGVNVATAMWNASKPRKKVTVKTCDSQSTGEGAVECYRSLSRSVDVIVGPQQALGMNAIKSMASRHSPAVVSVMPVTYPAADSSIFQTLATIPDAVSSGLRYLKSRQVTRVALLTSSDAPGRAAVSAARKAATAAGVKIVGQQTFDPRATNVTPQAQRIASVHPQAVLLWTTSPSVVAAVQGLHAVNLDAPIMFSYTSMRKTYMQDISKAGAAPHRGMYFVGTEAFAPKQIPAGTYRDRVNEYYRRYASTQHEDPSIGALDSADSLLVAAQAAQEAKSTDDVKRVLQGGGKFWGVLVPNYTFSRDRHIGSSSAQLHALRWDSAHGRFALAA